MKQRGLTGRYEDDNEVIAFDCDDCDFTLRLPVYRPTTRAGRDTEVVNPTASRSWSVTKRKQRCPDCTIIARGKGWVA